MQHDDETTITVLQADPGKYWRDYGIMALVGMIAAGSVLTLIDSPQPAIGSLGAVLAVAVRALYLRSEVMAMRWRLTPTRVVHPDGQRTIPLRDLATVRTLLGDVQLITRAGDKYLLKHLADGPAAVALILRTRDASA
ncbi:MAG: hypothetical protein R3D60_10175 [Paracoccaceae bacterium]